MYKTIQMDHFTKPWGFHIIVSLFDYFLEVDLRKLFTFNFHIQTL